MHLLMLLPYLFIQLIESPAAVLLSDDCLQGNAHICFSKSEEQGVETLLGKLMQDEDFLRDRGDIWNRG